MEGHVFWKRVDNSKVWDDIVCVNQVNDQTIVEFEITRASTEFFSIGTHLTMTVRDRGNPGSQQPNDDWANVIWENLPCNHPIIPFANGLFGYLESDGNMVVNH